MDHWGAMQTGWVLVDSNWYYLNTDGSMASSWVAVNGHWYYMDQWGAMCTGWVLVGDEWYYFHEDGGMNLGDLELDNAVYTFSAEGALTGASWKENTGGGAYFAGCYDTQEQILFEQLCDEKRDQYFDARPDREQEYDGDMHTSYDRYAGLKMDVKLNRIAAARLKEALEHGDTDEKNSTYKELYIQKCEDGEAAFEKIMDLLEKQYSRGEAYQDTLDYYRYLGMAHYEADGRHWFMVVLKR